MLHPNAKDRIVRFCPTEFDVRWRNPNTDEYVTETVTTHNRWGHLDRDGPHPAVVFQFPVEGVPRGAFGDRMADDTYKEPVPHDDSIAYHRTVGRPMYAELHVTVAVKRSHGGIPEHVVADQIANEVYFQFQFNSEHFRTQGTTAAGEPRDYEWPMALYQPNNEGVHDLNQMLDEIATQQRQMIYRVDYRYWRDEEIPAVKGLEVKFDLDLNYDGEPDTDTDPIWIGENPYEDEDNGDDENGDGDGE